MTTNTLPIPTEPMALRPNPHRPLFLKRVPEILWNQVHAQARSHHMSLQGYIIAILQMYHEQVGLNDAGCRDISAKAG